MLSNRSVQILLVGGAKYSASLVKFRFVRLTRLLGGIDSEGTAHPELFYETQGT